MVLIQSQPARFEPLMKGQRPARLLLPSSVGRRGADRSRKRGKAARPSRVSQAVDAGGGALFEALRHLRSGLARQEGVPAYVVASDRTLRDIAQLRPRNLSELKLAHGIGETRAQRYGSAILRTIVEAG